MAAQDGSLSGELLGGGEAVDHLLSDNRRRRGGQGGRGGRGVAQVVLLQTESRAGQ